MDQSQQPRKNGNRSTLGKKVKGMGNNYYSKAINLLKKRMKYRRPTSPEKKFIGLCKKYKIKYEREYYLYGKFYDFYLPKYHVLV